MRAPKRGNVEYERILAYDEWIPGTIVEVKLEENRVTGFKDEKTGLPKSADQIRFKFALDGHEYQHYSRWMTYTFGEKSNLFTKYLKYLVEGAQPDMEFDLDELKGFKIKTMWSQNGDFDNLEQIRPLGAKLKPSGKAPAETSEPEPAEEVSVETEDIPL
jgi:hypothetical protein